jgi:hypothetical protein
LRRKTLTDPLARDYPHARTPRAMLATLVGNRSTHEGSNPDAEATTEIP